MAPGPRPREGPKTAQEASKTPKMVSKMASKTAQMAPDMTPSGDGLFVCCRAPDWMRGCAISSNHAVASVLLMLGAMPTQRPVRKVIGHQAARKKALGKGVRVSS